MTASSILAIVIIIAIALIGLTQGSKVKTLFTEGSQKFQSFLNPKKAIAPQETSTQTVTKNGQQSQIITAVITTKTGGTRVVKGSQGLIDRLKQNINDSNISDTTKGTVTQ